jgi:predicted nucleotidyltransferase
MNYKISSKDFEHPILKPLLEKLVQYFDSIQTPFYIIGATARDMIMKAHDESSGRLTHDLDIAIAIPDWERYAKIEEDLSVLEGFAKDPKQAQRFIYDGFFELDIVPFGNIMKEGDKIFWPPDETIAMSVLGFSEVSKQAVEFKVDDRFSIKVATLAGVFLLKIVAWHDRHLKGNKDADDIGFILTNYLNINEIRAAKDHYDIYEDESFTTATAGAKLLGRDLREILSSNTYAINKVSDILSDEVSKEGDSNLIYQIIETNRVFRYEEVLRALSNIIIELKNQQ